jgi:outer membrane lipoprotein-sorting protein
MSRWIHNCVLVLGAAALCAATVRAEDLASVEKDIIKKWQKHKSMRAKLNLSGGTEAEGNKAVTTGEGTFESVRKGDAVLFRTELKRTMEVEAGGQKMKFESAVLALYDGKYTYTLTEQVGMKTAIKSKYDPRSVADLNSFFESLRAEHNLKLLDEQSVDGKDAYAIEATPKSKGPGVPPQKSLYCFSKDDGVMLKQVTYDRAGKPLQTMTYTDIEFDVKIDPKRFEFEAPEGVIVQDRTGE